jgi:hypothetical protein
MAYNKRYNPDALPAHVEPEQVCALYEHGPQRYLRLRRLLRSSIQARRPRNRQKREQTNLRPLYHRKLCVQTTVTAADPRQGPMAAAAAVRDMTADRTRDTAVVVATVHGMTADQTHAQIRATTITVLRRRKTMVMGGQGLLRLRPMGDRL